MAKQETSPVAIVQNPAFGSILLWTFGRGFQAEKIDALPELTTFFLVLPLVFHGNTLRDIKSTNVSSGLSKLVEKLNERREHLVSVHYRALEMREITLQSVSAGIATKLLHLDYAVARVRCNDGKPPQPPERLKYHLAGAEKLGRWFARLPSAQVFSLLQVAP